MALANLGTRIVSPAFRSRKAVMAVAGTAFAAGLLGKVGKSAVSNTMDIAFGTPDADNYMLGGSDLTPSLAMGALVSGPLGAPARLKNAADLNMYGANSLGTIAGGVGVAASLGGLTGGLLGKYEKLGKMGGIKGAIAGGAIGLGVGLLGAGHHIQSPYEKRPDLFRNSPYYNTSLSTAERLNASGDIVLGMHNSRRG